MLRNGDSLEDEAPSSETEEQFTDEEHLTDIEGDNDGIFRMDDEENERAISAPISSFIAVDPTALFAYSPLGTPPSRRNALVGGRADSPAPFAPPSHPAQLNVPRSATSLGRAVLAHDTTRVQELLEKMLNSPVEGAAATSAMDVAADGEDSLSELASLESILKLGVGIPKVFISSEDSSATTNSPPPNEGAHPELNEYLLGYPLITHALKEKDFLIALCLLRSGASVTHLDRNGWTPLMHAINSKDSAVFGEFLSVSGDLINTVSADYQSAINLAIKLDFQEAFDALMLLGPTLEYPDEFSMLPPICTAARTSNPHYLQCLIAKGVHLDAADIEGHTPLMHAAFKQNNMSFMELSKAGASLSLKDRNQRTLMMHAACGSNVPLMQHLQKQDKNNLTALCQDGASPLMHCFLGEELPTQKTVLYLFHETIKILKETEGKDLLGRTAVHQLLNAVQFLQNDQRPTPFDAFTIICDAMRSDPSALKSFKECCLSQNIKDGGQYPIEYALSLRKESFSSPLKELIYLCIPPETPTGIPEEILTIYELLKAFKPQQPVFNPSMCWNPAFIQDTHSRVLNPMVGIAIEEHLEKRVFANHLHPFTQINELAGQIASLYRLAPGYCPPQALLADAETTLPEPPLPKNPLMELFQTYRTFTLHHYDDNIYGGGFQSFQDMTGGKYTYWLMRFTYLNEIKRRIQDYQELVSALDTTDNAPLLEAQATEITTLANLSLQIEGLLSSELLYLTNDGDAPHPPHHAEIRLIVPALSCDDLGIIPSPPTPPAQAPILHLEPEVCREFSDAFQSMAGRFRRFGQGRVPVSVPMVQAMYPDFIPLMQIMQQRADASKNTGGGEASAAPSDRDVPMPPYQASPIMLFGDSGDDGEDDDEDSAPITPVHRSNSPEY